jgi:anionic cell wall polymer biosynthesis LytR-Cps2A-Psr (LCP) family protein
MDHVVLVDFEGFIRLTDDLGGVTVTNKTAFTSHGHDYPKGKISIQGAKALWFVRERHALPRGDLDRAENQRKVLKAIVQKGLSAGVVADPATFTQFIGNVAKNVTVDNSLSDEEIRRTAFSLRLSGKDLTLLQAPISGSGTSPDGQSILIVNTEQLAELSTALQEDTMAAYVKKYPEN